MTSNGEFDFISRLFRPLAGQGALDLRDDAALITQRLGFDLAISTDTIVEGTHYLPDDPPETVGRKLMRVNLSDCAAIGAVPYGYFLNIARPRAVDDAWFLSFAEGLAGDQRAYGLQLLGGDTTSTRGPLVLTMTILGWVAQGQALRRNAAQPGDEVWVTGQIGDATHGLAARLGDLPDPAGRMIARYQQPQPRVGLNLYGIANAVLDISDGLVQDAGHIARESQVDLALEAERVPLSSDVRTFGRPGLLRALSGGDDYELLITCPPDRIAALHAEMARVDIPVTRIGRVVTGAGLVRVLDSKGAEIMLDRSGWQHF